MSTADIYAQNTRCSFVRVYKGKCSIAQSAVTINNDADELQVQSIKMKTNKLKLLTQYTVT